MNIYKEKYQSLAELVNGKKQELKTKETTIKKKKIEKDKLFTKYNRKYQDYTQLRCNLEKVVTSKDNAINNAINILWLAVSAAIFFITYSHTSTLSMLSYGKILSALVWIFSSSIIFSTLLLIRPIKKDIIRKSHKKIYSKNPKCRSLQDKINKKEKEYNEIYNKYETMQNEIDILEKEITKLKSSIISYIEEKRNLEEEIITSVIGPTTLIENPIVEDKPVEERKQPKIRTLKK